MQTYRSTSLPGLILALAFFLIPGSLWPQATKSLATSLVDTLNVEEVKNSIDQMFERPQHVDPVKFDLNGTKILLRDSGYTLKMGKWVAGSSNKYLFDEFGNLISVTSEVLRDGNFIKSGREVYQYDSNQNLTVTWSQGWNGSYWIGYSKISNEYSGDGKLILTLNQEKQGAELTNRSKVIYSYNEEGELDVENGYWWENDWIPSIKRVHIDRNTIDVYLWMDNEWVIFVREVKYTQAFRKVTKLWSSRTQSFEDWYQHVFTYDQKGNMTSDTHQKSTSVTIGGRTQWETLSINTYSYDPEGYLLSELIKTKVNYNLTETGLRRYYYSDLLSANQFFADRENIKVWPNPALNYLMVSSDYPIISVSIYSLNGELLTQKIFGCCNVMEYEIDISTLHTDLYFIKVHTNVGSRSFKIVREKLF